MNDQPLVSIIINNYNYGLFLAAAIESALSQTYHSLEVIIVDDGSEDNSRQIIHTYEGRLKAILKPNGGQASALNEGFSCSIGDIIIFLDADDLLLPDAARQVANAFVSSPNAAKVQYHMKVIDGQGRETGEIKPAAHLPLPAGDIRKQVLSFPFDLTWLPTSGNAFSAKVLRNIMPIPTADYGSIYADYYLCQVAALYGPVLTLADPLACYRVHGNNRYELPQPSLNVRHVRQTIRACEITSRHLVRHANQLGLHVPGGEIRSVSEIAQRLISRKLEPDWHPVAKDNIISLLFMGWSASLRRTDISVLKKIIFLAWFLAEAAAPHPLDRILAEKFLFPEKRAGANRLLGALNRSNYSPSRKIPATGASRRNRE